MAEASYEPGEAIERGEFVKLVAIIPGSLWQTWEAAKDKAAREGVTHPVQQIENGMVLEVLIAEYLAGF